MRIGFDYTAAVRQGAGIGRYTRQLVDALIDLDTRNEYVLLIAGGGLESSQSQASAQGFGFAPQLANLAKRHNVRVVDLPVSDRVLTILWHRLRAPLWVELFCGRLDIFHSPDFTLPPVLRARTILTVHDLSFIRVPESAHPKLRSYLSQVVPRSVRRADVVVADSRCTRADLVELLDADPNRIEVLYPGVAEQFQPIRDPSVRGKVSERYRLPPRFLLSLSTLHPRKNLDRLVEAYSRLPAQIRKEVKLVVAGAKAWKHETMLRRVEQLGLSDAVSFPGYIADNDLCVLYGLAEAFAFPSLYEGFGLEPLEAMACGTPVVASDVSSLPEVVGDAALMIDPLDVDGLAQALQRVLTDERLRSDLIGKGLDQARQFTWSGAATRLLGIYERTAA